MIQILMLKNPRPMANKEQFIKLGTKIVDGHEIITGLITVGIAAKMLGCSRNHIRTLYKRGNIRAVWVCYGEPETQTLFYKMDVHKMIETQEKELKKKLNQLKGES